MDLSTKARGDIAEYKVVAELLERGHTVLMPCGDRLPYDIGVDCGGRLVRIQVRRAWEVKTSKGSYIVDVRRSQTNRSTYTHTKHAIDSYDFLVAWIPELNLFYVIPSEVADTFGGGITLTEDTKKQRKGKAVQYKDRCDLIK